MVMGSIEMNVDAMGGWSQSDEMSRNFGRSALVLSSSFLIVALLLMLVAVLLGQSGSGGILGVIVAAAICLFAGLAAEAIASLVHAAGSPLGALLAGMTIRLLPPLGVCLILAVRGGGRENLAFVIYLLTFYLLTLTLDTWWAVRRAARTSVKSSKHPS
jgi:hypothetical protein